MSEARRSVEARGKNVEEAIQKGLAQLGARRDQVDIAVITEGSRGILGIGAEDARVRLTFLSPPPAPPPAPVAEAPKPAPRPVVSAPPPAPAEAPAPAAPPPTETKEERKVAAPHTPEIEDLAVTTVRDILQHMGYRAQVSARQSPPQDDEESTAYIIDVRGGGLNSLVGRRGEILDSLQYLTRLIIQQQLGQWASIVVDIDGYRERRAETLRSLANQMALRVQRDGRSISLEPMPPYERRIVHLALREHPAVTTVSIGEGESRKVTIRPRK